MTTRKPSQVSDIHWLQVHAPDPPPVVDSGKWMIFVPREEVDLTWLKVRNAVLTNLLGYAAKVSTARPTQYPEGRHVICVYTGDAGNKEDVMRVREKLRELGIAEDPIPYKTDSATLAGNYGKKSHKYRA